MKVQQDPAWFVGLIGFSYPEWSKTLYGHGATRGHRLTRYAVHFNAVEINTTFYGLPSADTVRTWAQATPPSFRFCVKMPRDVTHGPAPLGALAGSEASPVGHLISEDILALAHRFMETLQPLGTKLGAVLLQFPPKFTADRHAELADFLDRIDRVVPLAVEVRHDSWWTSGTKSILQDRGVCWVTTDESPHHGAEQAPTANSSDSHAPRRTTPTADFLYVRWLGKHGQFADRSKEHFDPTPRLRWWTQRLREILKQTPQVRTVYGFVDNDFAGHAPSTAQRFANLIGLPAPEQETRAPDEPTLFG